MGEALTPKTISIPAELPREQPPKNLVHVALAIVLRQFWIILSCLLLFTAGGVSYLYLIRPTYTASTTMMIDSRQGGIQQKSVLGDASPTDNGWIDSQIGILALERPSIGQSVSQQLRLGADREILGPKGALGDALIESVSNFLNRKDAELRENQSEAQIAQGVANAIAGGLEIRRVGFSYLVGVSFSAHNQEQAVRIANAAADAFVAAEMKAKYDALGQASSWLQERYQTMREKATAAERAVVDFKTKNNIVTAGGKLINDQQLSEINDRIGAARARTADEQSRLDQIETVIRDQETRGIFDSTVPDALLNPIVTKLRGQYLDLLNKEADWSKRFGPNHQAVVNLRNQARDIRASTHEELKRIAEAYRSDLEISKKNEIELKKQLTTTVQQIPNDAQIALHSLESTAQSYRTFYDNFFLNYTESIQQQSSPIPDTRVVSYATWAEKTNPSIPRTLFLSVLGGLVFGFGAAVLRQAMDKALRTSVEVHTAFRLDCLALIPAISTLRRRPARPQQLIAPGSENGRELIENNEHSQILNSSSGALRFMIDAPFSQFAEAIRSLKMAADLRGEKGEAKTIGMTSSITGEGKSTIATAIAALGAQVGSRAILLDCDLRNPALTQALAPHATHGILEVLSDECSLQDALWADMETGLVFLPAVNVSRLANTDQILAGNPMKELFATLRRSFDYIIVDLSPLLPVVDVRATTGLIDFYVFLIEWGQTNSGVVHQALDRSQIIYDSILGFALNKVNMGVIGRYEAEHRHKYYRQLTD
jgi:succinoglycan biosynthesis transport protein ExoP